MYKNQIEILEKKNIVVEIKITNSGLNSRMDETEKRISDLDDRTTEIKISNFNNREKADWKINEQILTALWDNLKNNNNNHPDEQEKACRAKNIYILEEIIAESFQNFPIEADNRFQKLHKLQTG